MARSDRVATSVTPEEKKKLEIIAQRRDVSLSNLLYEQVQDLLDEEDIPDEVLEYFEGNPNLAAATAD